MQEELVSAPSNGGFLYLCYTFTMKDLVDVITTGLIILTVGGLVIALYALLEYLAWWAFGDRDG